MLPAPRRRSAPPRHARSPACASRRSRSPRPHRHAQRPHRHALRPMGPAGRLATRQSRNHDLAPGRWRIPRLPVGPARARSRIPPSQPGRFRAHLHGRWGADRRGHAHTFDPHPRRTAHGSPARRELSFALDYGPDLISLPIPRTTIDDAWVSVFYSTTRGLGIGGDMRFRSRAGSGELRASVAAPAGGVAFEGGFTFDPASSIALASAPGGAMVAWAQKARSASTPRTRSGASAARPPRSASTKGAGRSPAVPNSPCPA